MEGGPRTPPGTSCAGVRGPCPPLAHGPRRFLGTLVSGLVGWASTENCLKRFSRLDGRYRVGEGGQVGLPENTAEKAPRCTNACGSGGRTSRSPCGRKGGIRDGLTSGQMRPLPVNEERWPGTCPPPRPVRTAALEIPSQSPPSPTHVLCACLRVYPVPLPARGPHSQGGYRAGCQGVPPGRGEFLLPHSLASRCWRMFYYLPLWLVRNGILMSF